MDPKAKEQKIRSTSLNSLLTPKTFKKEGNAFNLY